MTAGGITPKLIHLSWPLVLGNLFQTTYNLADMFWVGRLNAEAVAAVSLMFPTAWLFVSVAMGITAASVALVSQHIGADDERDAEIAVAQTVVLTVTTAVLLALGGFALRKPIIWLIGARGTVFTLSQAYLEIILLAIPFTFLFLAFRAVLRAAGDTKTAMWLVAVSAGLNIVIDPLFILDTDPLFGLNWLFLGLGVKGAAIATLVSRLAAALAGLYILLNGGWGIQLKVGDLWPKPRILRQLISIGAPGTADGLLRSLSAVALAALVARFGPIVTAAYGIGLRLMSVSWTVSGALGQAVATGVGQNLGARSPDRAASIAWVGTAGAMIVLFGFGALAFGLPATLMGVFIDDPAVIDEGVTLLRIIAFSWAFFGGLMVLQGGFRGAGYTLQAMMLSLLSRWIFRIPVMWALAYPLAWGPEGLWWGYTITTIVSFVVGAVWFQQGSWRSGVVESAHETPSHPETDPAEAHID